MAIHTAAALNWTDIQAALTAAEADTDATVEIVLPAGSGNIDNQLLFTSNINTTRLIIRGAGKTSTILTDTYENSAVFFIITLSAVNIDADIYGFKYLPGPNWALNSKPDIFVIFGNTNKLKIHAFHIDCASTSTNVANVWRTYGTMYGVMWDCKFEFFGTGGAFHPRFLGASGEGDEFWAEATNRGGLDYFFFEDNEVTAVIDSAVEDCERGTKWVARFNFLRNTGFQTHPTAGDRGRGNRALEIYCNDSEDNAASLLFNYMFMSSGCMLMWNNPITAGYKHVVTMHSMRKISQAFGGTYSETMTPDGWGYSGPARKTGTVDTSGTAVTHVSGDLFDTGWAVPFMMNIAGTDFLATSVNSTTSITLSTSAGTQSGAAYILGANWDGNDSTKTGYPCLDQVGRGEGDLLSGAFPNTINVDNGNANSTSPNAWPRQALEPVYIWQMPWTVPPGSGGSFIGMGSDTIQENRDYYLENPDFISGGGLTGVGIGTAAQMNSVSAVDGTAFWVTDEGSWNAGTNAFYTGQGRLYKRISGSWVLWYEPAAYPHPLRSADSPEPSPVILMGTCLT